MNEALAKELEQFIDAIGLKHFKGHELTYYWTARRNGVTNSMPPKHLWPNIVRTLIVADKLREITGSPLVITSSYRSEAYNAALAGAASGSQHKQFRALDLIPRGVTADELARAARKLRGTDIHMPNDPRHTFVWRGGIGSYPNFVHIDTRGYDASW